MTNASPNLGNRRKGAPSIELTIFANEDAKLTKRIKLDKVRFRVDFDAYNLFNSDWPFTVSNTFSTAANSNWLRPTNVLQARFFKIGAQFDF